MNERHLAQYQNMTELLKTIKAGDEPIVQLLNQVDLMEKANTMLKSRKRYIPGRWWR